MIQLPKRTTSTFVFDKFNNQTSTTLSLAVTVSGVEL